MTDLLVSSSGAWLVSRGSDPAVAHETNPRTDAHDPPGGPLAATFYLPVAVASVVTASPIGNVPALLAP